MYETPSSVPRNTIAPNANAWLYFLKIGYNSTGTITSAKPIVSTNIMLAIKLF